MAELIAASSAIGVASSLVTFCEVAWKVVKRLKEYNDRRVNVPKELRNIVAQLPLLIEKVDALKRNGSAIKPESPLASAIVACEHEITSMESLCNKLLPTSDDSNYDRFRKALGGVIRHEKQIIAIWSTLQSYISTFTLHLAKVEVANTGLDQHGDGNEDFQIPFSLQDIPLVNKFVPRDTELGHIEDYLLTQDNERPRRKVLVVHGLGGIGKTQLVVEYARKHQRSYSAVLWVNGASKKQIQLNIARLVARLPQHQLLPASIQSADNQTVNRDAVVQDVLRWLSRPDNNQWLLIIDNADRDIKSSPHDEDAFNVDDYLPKGDHGSIIITTRVSSLERFGHGLLLSTLSEEQGIALLRNELGRELPGRLSHHRLELELTSNAKANHRHTDLIGLHEVFALVQGLPLALAQAGSYMRQTNTLPEDYLKLYRGRWSKLMEKEHNSAREEYQIGEDHQTRSVWTTWSISMESIRQQNSDAANLLILCSFLNNRDIWYELLGKALPWRSGEPVPEWLARVAGDELDFKESMQLLIRFSLMNTRVEGSSYSMHPVLHRWCSHAVPDQTEKVFRRIAVNLVDAKIIEPALTIEDVQLNSRLLPHCETVMRSLTSYAGQEQILRIGSVLQSVFRCIYIESGDLFFYLRTGKFLEWGQSFGVFEFLDIGLPARNIEIPQQIEKRLVEESTLDAQTWFNSWIDLGETYTKLGEFGKAEEMYIQALFAQETPRVDHPRYIEALRNLGMLYKLVRKLDKASEMLLKAVERGRDLGQVSYMTHSAAMELALIHQDSGRLKDAEELCLRVLSEGKELVDAGVSDTREELSLVMAHIFLATLYEDMGRREEAKSMCQQALHETALLTINGLIVKEVVDAIQSYYKGTGDEEAEDSVRLGVLLRQEQSYTSNSKARSQNPNSRLHNTGSSSSALTRCSKPFRFKDYLLLRGYCICTWMFHTLRKLEAIVQKTRDP